MHRLLTGLLTVALLMTGCASRHSVSLRKPIIQRIAIIPASNPTWYSFENAAPLPVIMTSGLAGLGYKLNSRSKAKAFNKAFLSQPSNLGSEFTAEVAAALRAAGFSVEILEGVKRPADDPDNIDYDRISSDADAILHLWISEVGLYSSMLSNNYIPRVNASGKLFVKGQEENIYEEEIDYGVDAKKGKQWAIVPDARFAYPSFDFVMSNIEEIRASFAVGALEISKRMSEHINNSPNYSKAVIRTATP